MSPAANTALLLVDVQQGIDDPRRGPRDNPGAERRIADLLAAWRAAWRAAGRPVIHVRHLSLEPGSPLREGRAGAAFKPEAAPLAGEPVFRKHTHGAFIGTDLEADVRAHGIADLVIVGLPTDHRVSTTVRMARSLGFGVTMVAGATATFGRRGSDFAEFGADPMHRTALASLRDEFASVRSAHEVLVAFAA